MSGGRFINYWIGQEPTGPGKSPTLAQMPPYVDIAPLAFVGIDRSTFALNFDFLIQQNSAATIQGWAQQIRANGTKVLLSINSRLFGDIPDPGGFAASVADAVQSWNVDGVDIDFEPPYESAKAVAVVDAIRAALPSGALMTAPVYGAWLGLLPFLKEFAASFDYITTMDYTPYPGFQETVKLFNAYASVVGASKLAVGISCMNPPNDFTPLADVEKLCAWQPDGGAKAGAMLYTFSYDIETRPKGGTGYPDGTWTSTINASLPPD